MSELIPTKHLQIRFKFHDVLILLVAAALIGWCMLVLPSMDISYDVKKTAIAGVAFLLLDGVARLVIFRILGIKSKDDFSKMPKFIGSELAKSGSLWLKTLFCGQKTVSLRRFYNQMIIRYGKRNKKSAALAGRPSQNRLGETSYAFA